MTTSTFPSEPMSTSSSTKQSSHRQEKSTDKLQSKVTKTGDDVKLVPTRDRVFSIDGSPLGSKIGEILLSSEDGDDINEALWLTAETGFSYTIDLSDRNVEIMEKIKK